MQLLGHAYVSDRKLAHHGLAGIATLVSQARAEAAAEGRATLLLDNGDLVQGTALSSWAARQPVTASHPVAATLSLMGYDAIGLGNHDLDFGLGYVQSLARQLPMPVISSNLVHDAPSSLLPSALIDCPLPGDGDGDDDDDEGDVVRVGVLSVLPEQTAIWNRHVLQHTAQVLPARTCIEQAVPALRAQGADLIVLLAHMGIEDPSPSDTHRESALPLARLPGIDAVITGHTHRRFPGNDHRANRDIDTRGGTLAQCPASMPGYAASDLAMVDLTLNRTPGGRWTVIGHVSRLLPNTTDTPAATTIVAACTPAHVATRAYLAEPVARTTRPLNTYFSMVTPTSSAALTARAKALTVQRMLAGTADENLPIVATASAHTAGGREGPLHFLDIPAGQVLRRHIAGLDPYLNEVWAVRATGADLRQILEHAARIYTRVSADAQDQPLIDAQIPGFDFDTIFGLEYTIDPSRPIGQRIRSLDHRGAPIDPAQPFVLATSQFRIAGGGGYPAAAPERVLSPAPPIALSDAVVAALNAPQRLPWEDDCPWILVCDRPVRATFRTSPAAQNTLHEIAAHSPRPLGFDDAGFLKVQITL